VLANSLGTAREFDSEITLQNTGDFVWLVIGTISATGC
jgi:hypothetical protein